MRRDRRPLQHSKIRAYTLVELLIVITLMVTIGAFLAPMMLPSPARVLQQAAGDVATALRETRREARAKQMRTRFSIDTADGRYGTLGMSTTRALPQDVQARLTTAESLLSGDTAGGIDFFPDGSSSGGRIVLHVSDIDLQVDVEWLTGRIRIAEVTP